MVDELLYTQIKGGQVMKISFTKKDGKRSSFTVSDDLFKTWLRVTGFSIEYGIKDLARNAGQQHGSWWVVTMTRAVEGYMLQCIQDEFESLELALSETQKQ